MHARVLWLALSDARGHLFRAHLMRQQLSTIGVEVDIATTRREGVAFLQSLGTPSVLMPGNYCLEYDAHQNLSPKRTRRRILRYLLSGSGCWRDYYWLASQRTRYDLFVNDSFHPALLWAAQQRRPMPIVNVFGDTMHQTVSSYCRSKRPTLLNAAYERLLRRSLSRVSATIVHSFQPQAPKLPRSFSVRPIVAAPQRDAAQVRRALGVPDGMRLAAVYLNPHFTDPLIATSIEDALNAAGYFFYGVSEAFSSRPGWRHSDPTLGEVIAASDLLLSAPGMASVNQALLFDVPLLAIASPGQPEQQHNIERLAETSHPHAVVTLGDGDLSPAISRALAALPERHAGRDSQRTISEVQRQWVWIFSALLGVTPTPE